ncbi:hypothetical protein [Chryseobacterium koreense]
MENNIQYREAKNKIKERIAFVYFSILYLVVLGAFLFIDFYDLKVGFITEGLSIDIRNILLTSPLIILLMYGIYLFLPNFRKWEETMIDKLTLKFKKDKNGR